jgi:deazaflavin-dependent oxidoreductase (nitroreductase family)
MTTPAAPRSHKIPPIVHTLSPLVRRLLRIGMPMGQNALLTVRGRTTGEPRSFPVTVLETGGRRYVFAAFGETNWVLNLRAAGVATLRRGRRDEQVVAVELPSDDAAPILQASLAPVLKMKMFGPMIGGWYGITSDSSPADYLIAARNHAAFELRPAQ